jgi:hypothetical protein
MAEEAMQTDKNLRCSAKSAIKEIADGGAQAVKLVKDALTKEKNEEIRTSLASLIKSLEDRSKMD